MCEGGSRSCTWQYWPSALIIHPKALDERLQDPRGCGNETPALTGTMGVVREKAEGAVIAAR